MSNSKCITITPRCTPTTAFSDSPNYDCDGNVVEESACTNSSVEYPTLELIDSGLGSAEGNYVYIGKTIKMKITNYSVDKNYLIQSDMTREDDVVSWVEVEQVGYTTNARTVSIAETDGECTLTTKYWVYPSTTLL